MSPILTSILAALALSIAVPAAAQPYLFAGAGSSDINDERSGTGVLAVGYTFNRHFSAEVSAADLGLGAAVIGHLQMGNYALLAKAGMQHLGRKWAGEGSRSSLNTEDLGTKATFGLGAAYVISQQFGIRGMVERIGGGHSLATIGITVSF